MTPSIPFRALYESKGLCPAGCGYRLRPGEFVRFDDNDELVHDACVPAVSKYELGPREIVCPDCRLIRPCPCLD